MGYFENIDLFLGESDTRFFGGGFLRTRQALKVLDIEKQAPHHIVFCGTGAIEPPDVWSLKGMNRQRPHMSSIDALELAIAVASWLYPELGGTGPFSCDQIVRIEIVAGTSPKEDGLDNLRIAGEATRGDLADALIQMDVAEMKVRMRMALEPRFFPTAVPAESQSVSVDDLIVVKESQSAAAVLCPADRTASRKWSLASCFANGLQLGQVLLYVLDEIDRGMSNTLWMRRFAIDVDEPIALQSGPQSIHTRLKNVKLLRRGNDQWRCADVVAVLCGVRLTCSVTHMLPGNVRAFERPHA